MKIKLILPALQEAKGPYWRPIKYSLFPPLGLATLASFCSSFDEIEIVDEHVEEIDLDDNPDLVCIHAGAWKKFGPVWNYIVKHQLFGEARKVLEYTLQ